MRFPLSRLARSLPFLIASLVAAGSLAGIASAPRAYALAPSEGCQNNQEIVRTAGGLGLITVVLPGSKNCFADDVPDEIACNLPKENQAQTCFNQAVPGVKTDSGVQIVSVAFYSQPGKNGCHLTKPDLAQLARKLNFDKAICYPKNSPAQMAGRASAHE